MTIINQSELSLDNSTGTLQILGIKTRYEEDNKLEPAKQDAIQEDVTR